MAPIIIMTLAIADSVHILVTMFGLIREGQDKLAALRESLRINFVAVAITSVTTIVGFLSLNFSDAPPFWHLGNITAVGIAAALFYSVTFLPALITLLPVRLPAVRLAKGRLAGGTTGSAVQPRGLESLLGRVADWVTSHYRPVLLGTGAAAVVLIAMVPMIDLNDEWVKYFDYRTDFRGDAEFAMDNLNGIYLVEYSLDSGEQGGISNPAYLKGLEGFTAWLREQPEVTHVYSYSDIAKRLNKNMHGDDPAWYRMPQDRELAAQYLLLYELSLPYGLDLNDRISVDKSASRVTASVGEISTAKVRKLIDRADTWLAVNAPASMQGEATGATVMFSHISERNINSMLTGNALALLLIAGIMIMALRSLSIGTLSLLPNAVPIMMTFGLWAVLVGQVGMAAATVSATSLGIVVDDTVHFLAKYLRARREKKLDRPQAIRYAFLTVGRAIISTTVILAFGFGVLALSTFRVNAQMGLLTALAILIALPVDFLLLPSLLMIGARTQSEHETTRRRFPMKKRLTSPLPGYSIRSRTAVLMGAALLTATVFGTTGANTPEQAGFEIAARSDRSDRGFGDSTVDLTMVLRNKAGKQTTRELSLRTLEVPDESVGDRTLVIFDSPRDIDGTALLSHAKILDPDDQWLYLPALKRIKRISSVNKSGPFVGSEFAFEDFTALELNKYDYTYLRTESCSDMVCDVVENRPRYEHSGYTRQVAWVDQEVYQIRKIEFYDRRGDLLKTLSLEDYRQYDDAYWRPHHLAMVNHQTGKSTDLDYSDYEFGSGLDEGDFVKGVLARIR
jgi:outer membrane lipoprotein-sorting protein